MSFRWKIPPQSEKNNLLVNHMAPILTVSTRKVFPQHGCFSVIFYKFISKIVLIGVSGWTFELGYFPQNFEDILKKFGEIMRKYCLLDNILRGLKVESRFLL